MKRILKIASKLKTPRLFVAALFRRLWWLFPCDRQYIKMMYYLQLGVKLHLENPQTYTEKLQWLKLYYRDSKYTTMVDKFAVKEYVANIIGEKYIIPTIGVWDKPSEIEWDKLPEKFVLKVTHGGGGNVLICKDKGKLDKKKAVNRLQKALKVNIYGKYREWPYKNVPRRVIAEQLLEENRLNNGCGLSKNSIEDYKFFCFNGEPKVLLVASNRFTTHNFNYFDEKFNPLPITSVDGSPIEISKINKPVAFDEMILVAKKLSQSMPFVRVDLYCVNGKVYFGELTLFDSSGYDNLSSEEWNQKFGEWIDLPKR